MHSVAGGSDANGTIDLINSDGVKDAPNTAEMILRLQTTMAEDVGPYRSESSLRRAIADIEEIATAVGEQPFGSAAPFDMQRLDWFDLRNMTAVARAVAQAALNRTESRGAHQREDFPGMLQEWNVNQVIRLKDGKLAITKAPASIAKAAAQ